MLLIAILMDCLPTFADEQPYNYGHDRTDESRSPSEHKRWIATIQNKVQRNWVRPINSVANFHCDINLQILPGGGIVDLKIIRSCGSLALDESVKRAVTKSDPLPMPTDPEIFDHNLNFTFEPPTE